MAQALRVALAVLAVAVAVANDAAQGGEGTASTASFRCGGQGGLGRTIPASFVNDDFCDCPDGSDEPETAACAGRGSQGFVCSGAPSTVVAKSKVGDGLCDCCDGSDEAAVDSHQDAPLCKNTCVRHFEERIADLQLALQRAVKGLEVAAKFRDLFSRASTSVGGGRLLPPSPESESALDGTNATADSQQQFPPAKNMKEFLEQTAVNISSWMEIVKKRQEQSVAMRRHHPSSRAEYEHVRAALRQNAKQVAFLKTQIQMREHFSAASFGPNGQLFDLVNCGCFASGVVSEIDLKGGSENQQPKTYRFFYCPFNYIIQVEVPRNDEEAGSDSDAAATSTSTSGDSKGSTGAPSGLGIASGSPPGTTGIDTDAVVAAVKATNPLTRVLVATGQFVATAASWVGGVLDQLAPLVLGDGATLNPARTAKSNRKSPHRAAGGPKSAHRRLKPDPAQEDVDAAFKELTPVLLGSSVDVVDQDSLTTLGFYQQTAAASPQRPGSIHMLHAGGEACPLVMRVGGISRHVTVEVVCGASNRIASVVENGMCMYELRFESPFACTEAQASQLRQAVAQAEQLKLRAAQVTATMPAGSSGASEPPSNDSPTNLDKSGQGAQPAPRATEL
eukprot:INCI8102.1.p1 GENE.INCI8102.1~~INCI8102.1.p1  ORF type:complete len:658 (+),score=136.69 INCI8102.1:119-1975(+)